MGNIKILPTISCRNASANSIVKNLKNFSKETYFELYNDTNQNIVDTHIFSVDDFDFNGVSRPNKNLNGRKISAHGHIREREELTFIAANCPFKIRVTFDDGTVDEFRVSQKDAIGEGNGFWTIKAYHEVHGYRSGKNTFVVKIQNTDKQLRGEKNADGNEEMTKKISEGALNVLHEDKGIDANIVTRKMKDQESSIWDSLKFEANNLFNHANNLEQETSLLFKKIKESNDHSQAHKVKSMYKGVVAMYELAVLKFKELAKKDKDFIDKINFTKETIEKIEKLINEIENFDD